MAAISGQKAVSELKGRPGRNCSSVAELINRPREWQQRSGCPAKPVSARPSSPPEVVHPVLPEGVAVQLDAEPRPGRQLELPVDDSEILGQ